MLLRDRAQSPSYPARLVGTVVMAPVQPARAGSVPLARARHARIGAGAWNGVCGRAGRTDRIERGGARAGFQSRHSKSQVRARRSPGAVRQTGVDLCEQRGCDARGVRQHRAQGREGDTRQIERARPDRPAHTWPLRVHGRIQRRHRQGCRDRGIAACSAHSSSFFARPSRPV